MLREDQELVRVIAGSIAREECAKTAISMLGAIKHHTPKPVEVDIDGIVKLVLDKIKLSTPAVAAEAPKKGKEK